MGANVSSRLPIALSWVCAAALAVAAAPAAALGLGQLQVKSSPGQPLVAEIPIISSDPTELQGLQVQLASPDTFTRVGLEPPAGQVSSLRFEPSVDAGGRPVIRVTSPMAVDAPLLTFLLQVDWSQGRLVREYSALIDTPNTVAAPMQPSIQAPSVAPSNVIARQPEPAPVAAPQPEPAPAVARPTAAPAQAKPAPVAAASTSSATEPVVAQSSGGQFGPVRAGQTLGEIAASVDVGGGHSAAQTMLALLRANPDAFIGGNVNLLKQGAILKLPAPEAITSIDRSEAAALLHAQITQWRAARAPQAQPDAVAADNGPAPRPPTAAPGKPRAAARLEIVPPSAGGRQRAGTQSGIEAGGEGEMLRQQLQETKESLAARDAEVNELKSRVAELEKLQQQQQQLLTLKDSALAAAQQTLAKSNRATAAPMPIASAQAAQAQPPAPTSRDAGMWLWLGLALVAAAVVGWLATRKRQRSTQTAARIFDTEALAATLPAAPSTGPAGRTSEFMPDQLVAPRPMQPPRKERGRAVAPAVVPPWHAEDGGPAAVADAPAPASMGSQLDMAQSCLDRGDDAAARVLLREVMNGRDPVARETAARLLRDL
jgi:pilus assembly protein FimV